MRLHFGLRLQPELRPWRASVPHVRGGHWGEERRRGGCGRRAGRAPGPHVARPRSWGWGRRAPVTRLLLQNLASRAGEGVGGNYPTANGCGYLVKVRGRSRSRSPLPHPRQPHSSYHIKKSGKYISLHCMVLQVRGTQKTCKTEYERPLCFHNSCCQVLEYIETLRRLSLLL